jgi:ABC-type molybdate transport system substrate-binding protein
MGKPVAKLKVMCARSMQEVVTALAYDFTRETSHEVELSFATVGALQKRLDKGETSDVLISAAPAIDHLMKTGALVAGSAGYFHAGGLQEDA